MSWTDEAQPLAQAAPEILPEQSPRAFQQKTCRRRDRGREEEKEEEETSVLRMSVMGFRDRVFCGSTRGANSFINVQADLTTHL